MTYRKNGLPFRPQDWAHLKKIAEGIPDDSKIGAFGVVMSGNQALAFVWKAIPCGPEPLTTTTAIVPIAVSRFLDVYQKFERNPSLCQRKGTPGHCQDDGGAAALTKSPNGLFNLKDDDETNYNSNNLNSYLMESL